jgi:hypothetical protein
VTIKHTPMRLPGSHCSTCCPCCAAERVHPTGPESEGAPGKSNRLDLDSATRTTRLMSCGGSSGRGCPGWHAVPGERMKQTINSDGAGLARA